MEMACTKHLFNRVLFQFRIKRHLYFANKNLFFKFFVAFDNSLNFNDARHWMQKTYVHIYVKQSHVCVCVWIWARSHSRHRFHIHNIQYRLWVLPFFVQTHIKNIYLKFIVPKSKRKHRNLFYLHAQRSVDA